VLEMADVAFIANLSGYVPGAFSLIELLDNFYARQHDDGYIPRAFDPDTERQLHQPYDPNSTGPNLLAWVEWRHFRLTGDRARVSAVFRPLLAHHHWRRANRTWRSGLYWTTAEASGLVNQPRVPGGRHHHRHWVWVDACAQAAVDCVALERMAALLDEPELAAEIRAEHSALVQIMNAELWNDETHFYQDISPEDSFSPVKSIAAYWALHDPQLVPRERLIPFVQHLRDPWSFRPGQAVPSLSADSEGYNAKTGNGWRGAVWSALTHMVVRGLAAVDQHALAHQLALSHVDAVYRVHEHTNNFWASYAPEELGPGEPAEEDHGGQTAAAIIGLLLGNVLGLSIDWPLRQVTWRRGLTRTLAYGAHNVPLGREGTLDLTGASEMVRVRADAPFTLTVIDDQNVVQTGVPAGVFEFSLR
jgi:glycogen debranching enzyme